MRQLTPIARIRSDFSSKFGIPRQSGLVEALKALADKAGELGVDLGIQTVFISHGDCLEEANFLADIMRSRFGVKDVVINYVGPVIGAHSGPGTIALFFLGTER